MGVSGDRLGLVDVAAHTKKLVSLRLDAEVVEAARATGAGWQMRVNDLLRR